MEGGLCLGLGHMGLCDATTQKAQPLYSGVAGWLTSFPASALTHRSCSCCARHTRHCPCLHVIPGRPA